MTIQEWARGNQFTEDLWNRRYRWKEETFDEFVSRVSNNDENIVRLIQEHKFMPGGAILRNLGTQGERKVSLSNCAVIPSPTDSSEGIFESALMAAKAYASGQGCGLALDKLSPNGCKINNAATETTGAVSFMELYDTVTKIWGKNGRRKIA